MNHLEFSSITVERVSTVCTPPVLLPVTSNDFASNDVDEMQIATRIRAHADIIRIRSKRTEAQRLRAALHAIESTSGNTIRGKTRETLRLRVTFNQTFLILMSRTFCSSKKFLIDCCIIVFSRREIYGIREVARSKFFFLFFFFSFLKGDRSRAAESRRDSQTLPLTEAYFTRRHNYPICIEDCYPQ